MMKQLEEASPLRRDDDASSRLVGGEAGILIYRNALLTITVLGGVKIPGASSGGEGLDRLVVTLMVVVVEGSRPAVRHKLDLYNDNQTSKFARTLAGKLEVGLTVVEASMSELTDLLEGWRLAELKKQGEGDVRITPLTDEETARGTTFLSEGRLTPRIAGVLVRSGIVGEETNAMVLYRSMVSSKMPDPLGAICIAKSGTGKSYLMEKVAACFPEESKLECTQLTPASLYYMGRYELSHRILLIEDLEGAREVMYPLRELQSKKKISKTMTSKGRDGKMRSENRVVEGPIALIACTTADAVYEDNSNRNVILYLDGSQAQDARIMAHQGNQRTGANTGAQEKEAQALLRIIYRLLQPIRVVNPYAPLITLPKEVGKPRRTLSLLLNFIEVGTFVHQMQREQKVDATTGEVFIESTVEDIEEGIAYMKETLFRKSDELNGACRETLEWIRANVQGSFTAQGIRRAIGKTPRSLRRYLEELADYGYLERDAKKKHSTGHLYTLAQGSENSLPRSIEEHITQVIARVRAAAAKPVEAEQSSAQSRSLGVAPVEPRRRKRTTVQGEESLPAEQQSLPTEREVGQLAKVGQSEVGQPTPLEDSEKERLARLATEKIKRIENGARRTAGDIPPPRESGDGEGAPLSA